MNLYKYFLGLLFCSLLLLACSGNEMASFNPKDSYIVFQHEAYSVNESREQIFPIVVEASGTFSGELTVDFEFFTDSDAGEPAVGGKDYILLNQSKTLQFANGVGRDTIKIKTINDDLKNGYRVINIRLINPSADYNIGFEGKRDFTIVTILDDESQSKFEGIWKINGKSIYYAEGGVERMTADTTANYTTTIPEYTVTATLHPTEANTLNIAGIFNVPWLTIKLIVDEGKGEVRLPNVLAGYVPQDDGNPVYIYGFDEKLETYEDPVIGKILNDGTLQFFRYIAIIVVGGVEYSLGWEGATLKATWVKED
ncbi:MAG: hypothetical protein LBL90_09825 [Prevotellaceae bacterium]|jgi:hypothetical protein|nr:hypothetical protein [Prevotellaceae bacterium]